MNLEFIAEIAKLEYVSKMTDIEVDLSKLSDSKNSKLFIPKQNNCYLYGFRILNL